MSTIKQAIERKYPRYRLSATDFGIWCGESRVLSGTGLTAAGEFLVNQHNEVIDKLIEATELLNEIAPQTI